MNIRRDMKYKRASVDIVLRKRLYVQSIIAFYVPFATFLLRKRVARCIGIW